MVTLVPLPEGMEKQAGKEGLLRRILLGAKQLSPDKLREVRKHVIPSGWIPYDPNRGWIKSMLLGHSKHPLKSLQSRFRQGGIFGKGGIVRGELAFNPELFERVKRIKGGTATWRDYPGVLGHLAGTGLSTSFLVGMPAAATYEALSSPPLPGQSRWGNVLSELGSTSGWYLAGPLGVPAEIATSILAGKMGKSIGEAISPPIPPRVNRAPAPVSVPVGPQRNIRRVELNPQEHLQLRQNGYMLPPTGV